MSTSSFFQRDLLSANDLQLKDLELILNTAKKFKQQPATKTLSDKIIANCFFEPSTRTRLSFETAAYRLGANVIGFANDEALSIKKGETLSDTMRMLDGYADLIIIRHPNEGAAKLTAEVANCPVINAGDGANQHPTQALVDLFTMQECQHQLNGLSIALVGDLRFARTIHSFTQLCALFDIRLYLVSPQALSLPDYLCNDLKRRGLRFSFHQNLEEIIPKIDILYMTRIQQERFTAIEYSWVKESFILTAAMLEQAKPNLKILHPLPRVNEIAIDVDSTPYAYYFQQAANGVFLREALLHLILNEAIP